MEPKDVVWYLVVSIGIIILGFGIYLLIEPVIDRTAAKIVLAGIGVVIGFGVAAYWQTITAQLDQAVHRIRG